MLSLVASVLQCGEGAARGSSSSENPWAAEHIEGLPIDIRREVFARARVCGNTPAALHYFSVSIDAGGTRFVSLHFEDFVCTNRAAVCTDGLCLHQLYVDFRGRQRLIFSTRARDLRMFNNDDTVGIEVTGGPSAGRYRWQGGRFVRSVILKERW
ncbi:hypothetical protein ACQ86E_31195 [Bradyrhizobium betae]|uniref:hypothetical protein n=1 Tax=Bradyrhizobium betae TaxID=244734 RepID=UPI003D667463